MAARRELVHLLTLQSEFALELTDAASKTTFLVFPGLTFLLQLLVCGLLRLRQSADFVLEVRRHVMLEVRHALLVSTHGAALLLLQILNLAILELDPLFEERDVAVCVQFLLQVLFLQT